MRTVERKLRQRCGHKATFRANQMKSLNRAYTRLSMKRRYESWFLRFGLADGSGAWWIRYLLTNPGRNGCSVPGGAPAQVWVTWFPESGKPETFIQEFPVSDVRLASKSSPSCIEIGENRLDDNSCAGSIEDRGRRITWSLHCHSHFPVTLSNKGWIGFSRTPHSDGVFSGEIQFGDRVCKGDPLGIGVQGHNCGFRHRNFWTWMHVCFPRPDGSLSTLEALSYEMPLGLRFRKAVLWHKGQQNLLRKVSELLRDRHNMRWSFQASSPQCQLRAEIDAGGISIHRLPYVKTDCSGTFEVSNNSRAHAKVNLKLGGNEQELMTPHGAVLEMTGDY
jgi:hypothetical protein